MTRILAFSDIHNNVRAVEMLRAQEANAYDGILIAGDLGSESVADILEITSSFECPICFVYGNWDSQAEYEQPPVPNSQLIHHNVHRIRDVAITGFSGCPTH